ncbi:MAG: hypothetical protein GXP49_02350 [Deltaproteobacteria bacterium]|nr:hypothetical protein [Deltaproteobacteria bacterium]
MVSGRHAETRREEEMTRNNDRKGPVTRIFSALKAVFWFLMFAAYPFAVYWSLERFGTRAASLLIMLLLLPGLVKRSITYRQGGLTVLAQVGGIALLLAIAALSGNQVFLQQVPVLISLFLLAGFGWTLKRPPSMIERYARLMAGEITAREARYCNRLTIMWMAFFFLNSLFIEILILEASLEAWTLYVGLIGYLIVGFLITVEIVYRRFRFGRFAVPFLDRLEQRIRKVPQIEK